MARLARARRELNFCTYESFWDIALHSDGKIYAELCENSSGANYVQISSQHVANNGAFHHVAVVRQGLSYSLYLDGALEGTANTTTIAQITPGTNMTAGVTICTGIAGATYYQGLLDELSIYSRALSGAEIQALYNAGDSGKCLAPIYITKIQHFSGEYGSIFPEPARFGLYLPI